MLIHIPSEAEEQVRDLVRCRETFQREILKSRHYILKFMRRRGFIFREGTHWTARHMNWIRHVLMPGNLSEEDRVVLGEYLALLEYKLQRRDDLDRRIEELALTPRYKPAVDRICAFRGFKTQAAMVLATEVGDVRRFESPRQLMAYLGLVPSERSSGDRRRLAEKKPKQVAATAVARKMVGFLWAVLRDLDPAYLGSAEVTRAA